MPDLTLEVYAFCEQLIPYRKAWNLKGYTQNVNHEYELECSCKGYQFRKSCKHVRELEETRCTWQEFLDEPMEEKDKCPRCGGPVEYMRVGV